MPSRERAFTSTPGRKGRISVADALIRLLERSARTGKKRALEGLSLADLRDGCASILEFDIASSTVRSVIYKKPTVFEKSGGVGRTVYYKLSDTFVKSRHEK